MNSERKTNGETHEPLGVLVRPTHVAVLAVTFTHVVKI